MHKLAAWLISLYQRLTAGLPPVCRFAPSCSEYARLAFEKHGFIKGAWLTIARLARCHPFCPGGHDPVP